MKIRVDKIKGLNLSASIERGEPIEGRYYYLEDATTGTQAQNKAFHSLLKAWWDWMFKTGSLTFEFNGVVFNFDTPDHKEFKRLWKARYGAGNQIYFVNNLCGRERADSYNDIPIYAKSDFEAGNKDRIWLDLKSWSDYTKTERKDTIQAMINMIPCSGCDDKKVWEIIEGMSSDFGFKSIESS